MSPAGSRWRRDRRSSISLRIEEPTAAHCGSISISKAAVASSSRASASRSHCPRPRRSPSTSAGYHQRTSSSSSSSTRAVTTSGGTSGTPSISPLNGDRSGSGAARSISRGDRPGAAPCARSARSSSRLPRLRAGRAPSGSPTCASRITAYGRRPPSRHRARCRGTSRDAPSTVARRPAGAASDPRGLFPRYLCGEQTYWTSVGSARGGVTQALLNEEGMLEADRGAFSIEPFLYVGEKLVTWVEGSPTQELEQGFLPIPSSVWRKDGIVLRTTAFATGEVGKAVLYIRYRLENLEAGPRHVRFFAALRPFQVTPPWQAFNDLGGVSAITTLEHATGAVWVNRRKTVIPLTAPSGFGAAAFEQGAVTEYLLSGDLPREGAVSDGFGYASGALRYDLDLPPRSARDVYLATPFGAADPALAPSSRGLDGAEQFDVAVREWSAKLGRIDIRLPATARAFSDTFRTAAAHILINRDGPAFQPGPRRYARSWIRDGATMAAALLRAGCTGEVRDYVRWYARHQAPDGTVPCCVDRNGPDWLAEYDSQGELIYAVMEYFRFTGDRAFLAEMWPAVTRSVERIEALRSQRLTAEFQTPEKRACYGLLPESVSHEGYLAHAVPERWA